MKKHKIVILGSSSFTGNCIYEQLGHQYDITRINRSGIDADGTFDAAKDSIDSIASVVKNATVVINCISNGDVDNCEENPDVSRSINYDFVKELCILQSVLGFQMIHFSTNAIYDGEKPLYSEESIANPINKYGEIKYLADQFVESNSENYTILRPITMFGIKADNQRHNPFSFFYTQLSEHKDIVAVDDVYVNMLHIQDLVQCVKVAIDKSVQGTFNISGDDIVNRYEFVSMIKKQIPNSRSKVSKVSSDGFVTAAARPRNTSFDNSVMKSSLGVHPESLEAVLNKLVKASSIQFSSAA